MTKDEIIEKATNPKQYENPQLSWFANETVESPIRGFIWEYLKPFSNEWKGKKVLDIGAGSGWLLEEARKAGASRVLGVEPAIQNVRGASKMYPGIELSNSTFELFSTQEKFDVVLSVLAVSHLADVGKFFQMTRDLTVTRGTVLIVTMNYDYYSLPRFDYSIVRHDMDDSTYAISLKGSRYEICDIVRKNELYIESAQSVGLIHQETVPMTTTKSLISQVPKYVAFKDTALFDLMVFTKI